MLKNPVTLLACSLLFTTLSWADQPIVIHEWGTFTCLQDEAGSAIGGINVDTELLPAFVHNFAPGILVNAPKGIYKGFPTAAPRLDVTMRLETPVLYFHLPPGSDSTKLDVNVEFHGGWLTQFYPDAVAEIDHHPVLQQPLELLDPKMNGSLSWTGLAVGGAAIGPQHYSGLFWKTIGERPGTTPDTTVRVWTAPRNVNADSVTTSNDEKERFLFYRGVGCIPAPLRVSRDSSGAQLELHSQLEPKMRDWPALTIRKLWLVDIDANLGMAVRDLEPITLTSDTAPVLVRTAAEFVEKDYDTKNLLRLEAGLKTALMDDGLFDDEAQALIDTWESSYFKTPGLRLFFMVPAPWTETYLPLKVSVPAIIHRSMVGRIDVVKPRHRQLLQRLADVPVTMSEKEFLIKCKSIYYGLGRFANALLLDEDGRAPSPALTKYIDLAGLRPYKPKSPTNPPANNKKSPRIVAGF